MGKNVVILGAGASADSGVPLMNRFLDVAYDLGIGGQLPNLSNQFELVRKGRRALQATHSKSSAVNIYNLEAVLSAFEIARLIGKLPGLSASELDQLSAAYSKVITATIEETQLFPLRNRRLEPTSSYKSFAESIKRFLENGGDSDLTFITFNYDIGLDFALGYAGVPFSYGLKSDPAQKARPKLLKLHGSINWKMCSKCEDVVAWPVVEVARMTDTAAAVEAHPLRIGSNIQSFAHCSASSDQDKPVIVPPTLNKAAHHNMLQPVWAAAAEALTDAENVIIVGYSLPDEDRFFPYLLSLGLLGDSIIRRIILVDPNPEVAERYRKILGTASLSRFDPRTEEFSGIRNNLLGWFR